MTESKQRGDFFRRHKKLFIVLAVLAVAVAALAIGVVSSINNAAANSAQTPQTVALERMDLQQIVSGTGTLQSSATREVTSNLSYDITEVYVKEGDYVEAGRLLAQLDTAEIDADIADVRKNIANAESQDALALAQAERKLQDALNQQALDAQNLNNSVQAAADQLTGATAGLDSAQIEMDNKKALLDQANAALAAYPSAGEEGYDLAAYLALQQAVLQAQSEYEAAAQAFQEINAAVTQAQTSYDSAVQQRDTSLRQDSIAVENAQDAVNTQRQKDSAASYRPQLTGYLEDRENCSITAPVSGTITSMTAKEGGSAGGGGMGSAGLADTTAASASSALFTIEDTSRLEITSRIPEYDMVLVQTGMPVTITSDAVDGAEWQGSVQSISPKAVDDNGNFTVVVAVTSPPQALEIGMSTKFNIVTQTRENVFAVPYDAITTDAAGQSIVYAADQNEETTVSQEANDGQEPPLGVPVPVQTGMETDYYIEISGDSLTEGMHILTDPEGKNASSGDTGLGGFPMGGGM